MIIKKIISKNNKDFINSIAVREAKTLDVDFISKLYKKCIENGHFNHISGIDLKTIINEWIKNKVMYRVQPPNPPENIQINLFVAEIENNTVGFLIISFEKINNKSHIEIYMLAVKEEYQKAGVATALINHVESIYINTQSFYARCFKESINAVNLLKKLEYVVEKVSEKGTSYLRKNK